MDQGDRLLDCAMDQDVIRRPCFRVTKLAWRVCGRMLRAGPAAPAASSILLHHLLLRRRRRHSQHRMIAVVELE